MKRFTETLKWQDPWFRRLSIQAKMLWYYILDHCDNIGLVEVDLALISEDCRGKIKDSHLAELSDRLQHVRGTKYFVRKFIPFQYGKLSPACMAHKKVLLAIDEHGLCEIELGYAYPTTTLPLPNRSGRVEDKDRTTPDSVRVEIKAKINGLRAAWSKPASWSDAEDAAFTPGSLRQAQELTDEDWSLLKRYLASTTPTGSNFWQPRIRRKLIETFGSTVADAIRWKSKEGDSANRGQKPTQPLQTISREELSEFFPIRK